MDNKQVLISDLAEKYVMGRLEGNDLALFKELSKGEDENILKEEILFHQELQRATSDIERTSIENHCFDLIAEIEGRPSQREKSQSILPTETPEPKIVGIGSRFKDWKMILGLVAAVLGLWFFIHLINTPISPSMTVLADKHWKNTKRITKAGRSVERSGNEVIDTGKESLRKGTFLFIDKKYDEANETLSTISNESDFYANALILSGVTSYIMGEKEEAIKLLKQAANDKNLVHQEAKWRLGLVYLLEKDYDSAQKTLNELKYAQGYENRVEQLLQIISE